MTTAPFKLPLTPADFAAALEKGHGRALMHARQCGLAGVEASFINACLNEQRYDAQAEESRAAWLIEMAAAIPKSEKLLREVARKLGAPTGRMEDAAHRCELALELALRGCEEAGEYLRRSVRVWPDTGHIVGEMELLTLDGAEGLVRIVELVMREFRHDPVCYARSAMAWFDNKHGEDAARVVLGEAALRSALVAKFIHVLDEQMAQEPPRSTKRHHETDPPTSTHEDDATARAVWEARCRELRDIPAGQIIDEIESSGPDIIFTRHRTWARAAPKDALAEVFAAMLQCSEPTRLRTYLRVFSVAALATFDTRWFDLVRHPESEIRWYAIQAMSNYTDSAVRRFALDRLRAGRWHEGELRLLTQNYQSGDIELIEPLLRVPEDRRALHRLVSDLVDVLDENPLPECAPGMMFVYEQSPCSNCRRSAVCALLESGVAPDWLKEECQSDGAESIRELLNSTLNGE